MKDEKIYGPRIDWYGGECPVPQNTLVKVKYRDGTFRSGFPAAVYCWFHDGVDGDIVEYCAIIEQSDLEAAERLLRSHGYAIVPPAKPLTFEDVVPLTEVPPEGRDYWVVSPTAEEGVYRAWIRGRASDDLAIKRRMAYLEREHALIAARHIFGLKGGEL